MHKDQTVSPACQIVRQPFLIDAHTNYLQSFHVPDQQGEGNTLRQRLINRLHY